MVIFGQKSICLVSITAHPVHCQVELERTENALGERQSIAG